LEEQAEASDRLATIEKLQASVAELKESHVTLESEKSDLQANVDRLKTSLSFTEENLKSKQEEIEQLTADVQQVCTQFVAESLVYIYLNSSRQHLCCDWRLEKVKFFRSHRAHWAVLISTSVALSQTPAYTVRQRTQV